MTVSQRIFQLEVPEGFEWALPTDTANYDVIYSLAQVQIALGGSRFIWSC